MVVRSWFFWFFRDAPGDFLPILFVNRGGSPGTSDERRALGSISEAIVPDSCLLDRFVTNGDQDPFALLVHRHGPMVLAVCRCVCREEHLAEDAFQAAFLVLACRAGDVKPLEAVRAFRIDLKTRQVTRLNVLKKGKMLTGVDWRWSAVTRNAAAVVRKGTIRCRFPPKCIPMRIYDCYPVSVDQGRL